MDGLLLDSERLARRAFEEACAGVGAEVAPDLYERCIGTSWEATRALLSDAVGSAAAYAELDRTWARHYQALIDAGELSLKPGARHLLETLEAVGIPCGLATSTRRALATAKLSRTGILTHFSCLICGGETPRGKPHPDPYLAAVAGLGVLPPETWALEDSENGVRSAHAAGLRVFQVPDLVPPSAALLELGHTVVDDLFDIVRRLAQES